MKKNLTFLLASLLVAISLILPCVADESTTEVVTEVATEMATEALTEAVDEPTEEVTVPTEPTEEVVLPDAMTEEDVEGYWEDFKAKITDSATWTMIGAALMTVLTTVATIKSGLDKFKALVHSKADNETVQASLKEIENELKKDFNANYKKLETTLERYENALKNTDDNEQKMYAILTLFMTNCKISESAKAEILAIIADVKKYNGDISEVVEKAQEAIEKAKKEAEDETPPTPTLDKMLGEDYMELG
jgi:predicted ribosome quality control (RQC) complex YloA/Tae2 family protein